MDKQDRKKLIESYKAQRAAGGVFAIRNTVNGKRYLQATTDMQGSRNRFEFSRATGSCTFKPLEEDFKAYGADAFTFEVLEELVQKEGQSYAEFKRETEELYALLAEGISPEEMY